MKSVAASAAVLGVALVALLVVVSLAEKPPPPPGKRPPPPPGPRGPGHPPPPPGPRPRAPKPAPRARPPPPPPPPPAHHHHHHPPEPLEETILIEPIEPIEQIETIPNAHEEEEHPSGGHQQHWSYSDQNGWVVEYPECVGKHLRQSPIDIITSDVIFKPSMQLQFVDYDQDVEFDYKNTHHSVSLTPVPSFATPAIRVNWVREGEPDEYELQEIHFHWGHGTEKGSEHEINDERAAAEMHMVHYRKGLTKDQIGSVDNSVVVIGVFIESDNVEHNKLDILVKKAANVNGTDAEYHDMSPENLIHLLPENHHSFYTYNGSLTTPPCYEVVTWILMSEPVYMNQEQLEELSNLEIETAMGRQKIMSNHREIQPLLLRPVYASFNTTESVTYSTDRIGNRIGMPGQRLSEALGRFWKRIDDVRMTVRRAYDNMVRARRSLMDSLRMGGAGSAPPPPAQ